MIPKIIHYCWLSKDPYPEKIQQCINSWKALLPDYELVLWDLNRFPLDKSEWVRRAFESKKYAFAADYIRAYALYNYGGIYLDSDVEVIKSYSDLLSLPYFLGRENSPRGLEAATCGCEKGFPLFGRLLEYYDNRSFVKEDGSYDMEPMPSILRSIIDSQYTLHDIARQEDFVDDNGVINVFPADFFSPISWETRQMKMTDNTYSIHHFAASWLSTSDRIRALFHKLLGHNLYHRIATIVKKSLK